MYDRLSLVSSSGHSELMHGPFHPSRGKVYASNDPTTLPTLPTPHPNFRPFLEPRIPSLYGTSNFVCFLALPCFLIGIHMHMYTLGDGRYVSLCLCMHVGV
jgi:hypothetical protein